MNRSTHFAAFSLIIAIVFNLWSTAGQAQNGSSFKLDGQLRPRAEFRNGQGTLLSTSDDPAFFISNRTRLSAQYTSPKVTLKLAFQNTGVWGQQPQIESNGSVMLNEGYAKINLSPNWSTTIGRQALVYDDERILGGLDWHVSGRFHDALLISYQKNKLKIDVAGAYSANGETKTNTYYYPTGQPYKHLEFLWLQYAFTEQLSLSALAMNTGQQGGVDTIPATWEINNLQTLGGNLAYSGRRLVAKATFYQQLGKAKNGTSVNAYLVSINMNYSFAKKIALQAGIDILSGNDMKNVNNTENAFAPLYGTNHAFYGYMDYFYVGNHASDVGLQDLYGGVTFNPSNKLKLAGTAHIFKAMGNVVDAMGQEVSQNLGTEVDFTFSYKIHQNMALAGGYSHMFAQDSLEIIKGGDAGRPQNWMWLMLNVNLEMLNTNK